MSIRPPAVTVELTGGDLYGGDGLLLEGTTLYAVHFNTVSVIQLNSTGTTGHISERRTDPRFDMPTTIARYGSRFYLPNARFGVPSPESADYTVVAIPG
ncbi:hypothetical protein ACF1HJ_28260 [Streptomyces sp. NPDC013978]|uniref:hypothetical protein n=1 Tax=Streptomyces sp. NPDC013978 TaxID=3364869 RepID=UPI0036FFAB21